MHPHNTQSMPVAATAHVIYRLADDPTIRLAVAGDLGWHNGIGRIAEWSPLTPGAWTPHTTETMPVDATAVVEIEGADGSRWIDHAGALVWSALPADEGLITRYRVMQATATASTASTPGTVGGTGTAIGTGSGASGLAARRPRPAPRARRAAAAAAHVVAVPRRTVVPLIACYCVCH